MNRRLIILRHAQSSREDFKVIDHDRPLDEKGIRDSAIIASVIKQRDWVPDHVFVSSSLRTIQTLDNMGSQFSKIPKTVMGELYDAKLQTVLSVIESIGEGQTGMIIGHNPSCEMLLECITGNLEIMPTCSGALISEIGGKWILDQIIRPRGAR